jgi:hypothetical protein
MGQLWPELAEVVPAFDTLKLVTGQRPALDLSIFSPQRILEGCPLSENGLV